MREWTIPDRAFDETVTQRPKGCAEPFTLMKLTAASVGGPPAIRCAIGDERRNPPCRLHAHHGASAKEWENLLPAASWAGCFPFMGPWHEGQPSLGARPAPSRVGLSVWILRYHHGIHRTARNRAESRANSAVQRLFAAPPGIHPGNLLALNGHCVADGGFGTVPHERA